MIEAPAPSKILAGHLTSASILTLLGSLAQGLAAKGTQADLYIYGGAGLALCGTFRHAARDIDAYVPQTETLQTMRSMAHDISVAAGMDHYYGPFHPDYESWLDLNTISLEPMVNDAGRYFTPLPFENQALRLHVMKPEPQLALKLLRMSPTPKDHDDIVTLCDAADVRDSDKLTDVWLRHAPLLPAHVREHVDPRLFRQQWMVYDLYKTMKAKRSSSPSATAT